MLYAETRKKLLARLKRHEGRKLDAQGRHVPYKDTVGILTVGYGHNLSAKPIPGFDPARDTLSEGEAHDLLMQDTHAAELALAEALPWVMELDGPRLAVLVNMVFNLGIKGLLGFKNTLADAQNGCWAGAAGRMSQSKWAGQVGPRARELAKQMETGEWQ